MWPLLRTAQGQVRTVLPASLRDPCALSPLVAGTFSCTLKFTVRDCDPDTGVPAEEGYDDEYVVSLPCTTEENTFLGASDMNLRGSVLKLIGTEGLADSSSVTGARLPKKNWDAPLLE